MLCLHCAEAVYELDIVVGCGQNTEPVFKCGCYECYEFERVQEPRRCDDCKKLVTQWERMGPPGGPKRTVCRACLCPDYEPEFYPRDTHVLSTVQGPDEFRFSIEKMNDHLAKRHKDLGYPDLDFNPWRVE